MSNELVRINTYVEDTVECTAEDYWEMLVNRWEDFKYWLTAGGQQLGVISSTLAPGSRKGVFPRTRIIHLDNPDEPTGVHYLQETIFYANPKTRTVFYRVDGIGNMAMRDYVAVQTIDELEPGKCKISIASHCNTTKEFAKDYEAGSLWFHNTIIHTGAENAKLIAENSKKHI